jgi:hypothetical protein
MGVQRVPNLLESHDKVVLLPVLDLGPSGQGHDFVVTFERLSSPRFRNTLGRLPSRPQPNGHPVGRQDFDGEIAWAASAAKLIALKLMNARRSTVDR